ncbi:polynucleotidyl transferase, ribonuclease H-like superfamily protein [Wolffia australiana]
MLSAAVLPAAPPSIRRIERNLPAKWKIRAGGDVRVFFSARMVDSSPISSVDERGFDGGTSATTGFFLPPNAMRRDKEPSWSFGFSLGVDLGSSRTGLALGKGLAPPRPLIVLEMRGQKLEMRILEIAEKEEVDEIIIGLPKSYDGKENPQSNKIRSIAGRLAVRVAESGLRVYLQDEHGTSAEALDYMIDARLGKYARQSKIDSYSAVMILERYFSAKGHEAELVLPKNLELQEKLRGGRHGDDD